MPEKGRMSYHKVSKLTGKDKFYCWDWVKFWKYHHNPQQAVSWWIAWCFLFGSVLFLMAACSSLSHKVYTDQTHRACEYDWLAAYPSVFRACFFFWPGDSTYEAKSPPCTPPTSVAGRIIPLLGLLALL
ncbi:hypothetical protein WJX77_003713 [Trebouxia sp. C0004]